MGKKVAVAVAGTTSVGSIIGGIALMVLGGPIGMVAGAGLLSTGLGGGMNTI
jgi:hypothetical protein